jgi:hypothetical protein
VRERDGRHPRGVVGFVVAQPAQLGDRERRDRHETGAPREFIGAELGGQIGRRTRRARVVPQQGIADHVAVGIQGHHAVLLAPDRPRDDVGETAGVRDRRAQRRPPGFGVHLGAVRMGAAAFAHHGAGVRVHHDDLARLGRRVDPHDQRHHRLLSINDP